MVLYCTSHSCVSAWQAHFYPLLKSKSEGNRLILKANVGVRGSSVRVCFILTVMHRNYNSSFVLIL